ncbi:ATP-binding protein [Herminiimonas arsenitoxidans]|uniref:ATP-binding protein n=1 Tax=Herminiimonas arsenitoxidans TaxID=1809410 RepID=UPI0009707B64|nr:ATP-binding protein [Herminiimonas arsenitoxidans]
MSIKVGEVIAVSGIRITLKIDEKSSRETLFLDGEKYKGVSIREYLYVQRGFRKIVCLVEGEYLDESRVETFDHKVDYVRKVDARPIGYFENEQFKEGIKFMPMIKDEVFLLKEEKIAAIYGRDNADGFFIGKMLKEEIPISMPWQKLFNSHIGIFGNTGSGKSNTLAKLYTVLFEKMADVLPGKSTFVFLDFNGEYTGGQLTNDDAKQVLRLSTQEVGGDKFTLSENEFWDVETLSILFQATQNTQRPFLTRIVDGRRRNVNNHNAFSNYIKSTIRHTFCAASPKSETLDLVRRIASIINDEALSEILNITAWHNNSFVHRGQANTYLNADGRGYAAVLAATVDAIDVSNVDPFDQLVIRANLQLSRDLVQGYVQFEHIQPLLKRIEASLNNLRKVVTIGAAVVPERVLTVISLRRCNNEVKKVLPLLIAKNYYHEHRRTVQTPPNKTIHLVIDEAHNILSQQSSREHESWKDHRLELFEEIIKEGRKFGMFITISSQRPADISPTIVSQLHNFFIHRLVNDRDLFLLDNTITTLDGLSKALIPTLAKGCCVVTGTAFDLPMVLQIDPLQTGERPDSDDVDLVALWA